MRARAYRTEAVFSVLPYLDVVRGGRCVWLGWLLWAVSLEW